MWRWGKIKIRTLTKLIHTTELLHINDSSFVAAQRKFNLQNLTERWDAIIWGVMLYLASRLIWLHLFFEAIIVSVIYANCFHSNISRLIFSSNTPIAMNACILQYLIIMCVHIKITWTFLDRLILSFPHNNFSNLLLSMTYTSQLLTIF